jgi:hypothetical protein
MIFAIAASFFLSMLPSPTAFFFQTPDKEDKSRGKGQKAKGKSEKLLESFSYFCLLPCLMFPRLL